MREHTDTLVREADAAAQRGDLVSARQRLRAALDAGEGSVDLWLRLAGLSRAAGEPAAALHAVDQALAREPLHFIALLMRASVLEQMNAPAVGEAYGRALAQRPSGELPPALRTALGRAEQAYAAFQAETSNRLERSTVAAAAAATPDEQSRIARFRTNTVRLTRPYHSEPTHYHYPGLVEREFHDRATFPWLAALEAATDTIADDFARVVAAERAEIAPYVQYPERAPLRQWQALNNSHDWSAIHLVRNGAVVAANAKHCPATMALLEELPQPEIPGLSPNAMFSLLAPGAHIPPHTGVANTRLVCHLPLVVPPGCWFRVGAETRDWVRGQAWVFDDTIEHEAMNPSKQLRVILIVDLWHPGLSARERDAVAAVVASFDAIDVAL